MNNKEKNGGNKKFLPLKGFIKTSLIDWPEKICSTVFLGYCNFRCPFCHNPELVIHPEKTKNIEEKEFFDFLKTRKKWLDGVCITGGEPTLSPGLKNFCKEIKKMGFGVKLDTNGSFPDILNDLLNSNLIDYVAMDIKNCFEEYNNTIGVKINTNLIKKSILILSKYSEKNPEFKYELRTTVVPKLHNKEFILKMFEEISKLIGKEKTRKEVNFYIQNFRPIKTLDPSYEKEKTFTQEELEEFENIGKKYFKTCKVR